MRIVSRPQLFLCRHEVVCSSVSGGMAPVKGEGCFNAKGRVVPEREESLGADQSLPIRVQ